MHIFVQKSLVFSKIPIQCKTNLISPHSQPSPFPVKAVLSGFFFAFSGGLNEAHCYFPFVCHTLHTGCSVLSVMFFPLFTLADIQRCVIRVVALKVALSIQAKKKNTHTQSNCYISKCSSKLGQSFMGQYGQPLERLC